MANIHKDEADAPQVQLDDKIALGVLLWVVAEADGEFRKEEIQTIKTVLEKVSQINKDDLPCILEAVELAAQERIDLHTFTSEVSQDLSREMKLNIIRNLFRVACADKDLDPKEDTVIRKIAGLFRLDHKEFIDARILVKKESGMDTAGL